MTPALIQVSKERDSMELQLSAARLQMKTVDLERPAEQVQGGGGDSSTIHQCNTTEKYSSSQHRYNTPDTTVYYSI